jgi:hypothetical protein
MQTDDKPYLVQRIINIEHGTSIDVGVVYALDTEHARELAVSNDLIRTFQAFHVLSLDFYGEAVPEHFRASAGAPEAGGPVSEQDIEEGRRPIHA